MLDLVNSQQTSFLTPNSILCQMIELVNLFNLTKSQKLTAPRSSLTKGSKELLRLKQLRLKESWWIPKK